ncbi:MAG TPA: hypothetical protein VGH69_15975 [Mycobacterium sp.]|jgi:hypothetical protein
MTIHEEQHVPAEPRVDENTANEVHEPQAATDDIGAETVREPEPVTDAVEAEPPRADHESSAAETLFADDDVSDLRQRWAGVQAAFVDNPKECVQKADHLVADLVEQLTAGFAQARSRLEEQWSRGQEASTEDLRMALMHYREFFDRLLAV